MTEFATLVEIADDPGAFFSSIGRLEINVPPPLTIEQFFGRLAEIPAEEWVVVVAFLVGIVLSLRLAAASDDQNAYQVFYPSWHARLLECGRRGWGGRRGSPACSSSSSSRRTACCGSSSSSRPSRSRARSAR